MNVDTYFSHFFSGTQSGTKQLESPLPQRACYQNILVVLVCIVAAWRRDARR